jgi:hypothetical protein
MRRMMPVVALALVATAHAMEPIPPYIEAWCDGGIDGRYQHATVDAHGTIRATNKHDAERPWPVVAEDPEAAERWFMILDETRPAQPPTTDIPAPMDGIVCGLVLNKGQESVPYDLPEVLREIVVNVPGYH